MINTIVNKLKNNNFVVEDVTFGEGYCGDSFVEAIKFSWLCGDG